MIYNKELSELGMEGNVVTECRYLLKPTAATLSIKLQKHFIQVGPTGPHEGLSALSLFMFCVLKIS